MNIVEAYIKFNKKLIILISGLSGSGKSYVASSIERDFKIKKINIERYCIKNNERKVTLPNEVVVTDWDHIDSYDWDAINNDVVKNMNNGVVVCGPYFTTDKIKFEPDFHINIKISKQQLIKKRHDYIVKNPTKCKELLPFIDTPTETLIINKITYPHFIEYMGKSKIDKTISAIELGESNEYQIYDQASDWLFEQIQIFLKNFKHDGSDVNSNKVNVDEHSVQNVQNVKNVYYDDVVNDDVIEATKPNPGEDEFDDEKEDTTIYLGTTYDD